MKNYRGFTLIEVMIVTLIVGVLAAIAYPSYLKTVARSNRTEATSTLMELSQRLQRCYSTFGRFDDPTDKNRCAVFEELDGKTVTTNQGNGFYEITLSNAGAATYTLTAEAVKAPQISDKECKKFILDQSGKKSAEDSAGGAATDCW